MKKREFRLDVMQQEAQAKGEGKSDEEIQQLVTELYTNCKEEARQKAVDHLKASLKTVEAEATMNARLSSAL